MSVVAANILRPFNGKRSVAEERLKKLGSVFERLAPRSRQRTSLLVSTQNASVYCVLTPTLKQRPPLSSK